MTFDRCLVTGKGHLIRDNGDGSICIFCGRKWDETPWEVNKEARRL